ncbi:fringe glycosyltransferase-like [Dermatophagoides farinae]|uniref:Fringe glycosyltransferase-like n=1 Tax=Dermatophagoides farinae TaxID=6954 RepID=A0A9D4P3V5_DERFA|nr:fringe glycosyltransferase-like [Dermatophagoides farinae]KAH7643711.1 fringe glycosyltransferase-like [Dermatophagoides farinae]
MMFYISNDNTNRHQQRLLIRSLCNVAMYISMCLLFIICMMVILWMPSLSSSSSSSSVVKNLHQNQLLQSNLNESAKQIPESVSSSSSMIKTNESQTNIDDIFITVKTTRIFHKSRLDIILDTWYTLAKNQTYFFTDNNDPYYRQILGDHIVNTNCSVSHNRKALCCKMSVEFDYYIHNDDNKKWWCHFDDDNYVNIPKLIELLRHYDPIYDWYLGKTSIKQPLEIDDREFKKKIHFSFATGGAGFCISRALALKMISVASNGQLISVGDRIRLPDDVTIGYIIEHMLDKKLTEIDEFHSHLEPMAMLEKNSLRNQVSFSYSGNNINNRNVLQINQLDSIQNDSTRFYSLHCYLFPSLCGWKKFDKQLN